MSQPANAFSLFGSKDQETDEETPVEVVADQLEYVKEESKIIGTKNVIVTYKNMRLTSDYAEVYTDKKIAYAEGHVVLKKGSQTLKGPQGEYDFTAHQGSFPKGTYINQPFYGYAEEMDQLSEEKIVLQDAYITTCPYVNTAEHEHHFDIKAKSVTVYPNDKIVAKNVKVRILGKPVFWLPILSIPLRDGHSPFHLQPGHSSQDGYYALASKRYSINENIGGKVHLDYRSKHGWGFGNDNDYNSELLGKGMFKAYITEDDNAPNHKFPNPYDNKHENTRYRFSWRHEKQIGRTNILAEYNNLSDKYLLKDFFQREYREEADPETYLNITHNEDNYGVFVNLEKRINHFVDAIEKLPEVRFNWNNQEIKDSNVYYKNETSVINFNRKRAHSGVDDDVVRVDTFHEFSYPVKVGFLAMKPYLNTRYDYYSKNSLGKENINRFAFGGGIDLNSKFYRIWDVNTNFLNLDINQVRHIFEPNVKYEFVRLRTVLPEHLYKMDSIDYLDDKDTVKVGMENRLQTKRMFGNSERTVDLVSFNSYLTYDYHSEEQGGSAFLYWENELEFRPYRWMTAAIDFQYDVPNDQFHNFDLDLSVHQDRKWRFDVQQRFLKEGSKILTLDGMYKINDLWGIGGYMRTEFDERNVIEEWEVRATRDLHCWFLDFGYNVRNSDIDSSNRELFFQLTLKAFPEYPLKSGNHASISRSRIGNTVSGANVGTQPDDDQALYEMIRY